MRLRPTSNAVAMILCIWIAASARAQEVRNIPQFTLTPDGGSNPSSAPGFFRRLTNYYRDDWFPPPPKPSAAPSSPAPQKRGLPSPLDSPPLPSSDWSYGGSPDIGAPDGNSYPLMTAINGARSRSKIYGWIEPGVNGSTSSHTNLPEVYDQFPNSIHLDQLLLYVERLPDTVQTRHFDWGYHFTAVYGTDYRYFTAKGYFSQQLLKFNRQYGADLPIEYVDLYFPHVAQGMNVRIGRFISVPGIEAQLAPNNYIFSHSILYFVDPFTDTGAIATIKLSDKWLVQAGVTDGHDVAPWTNDAQPSGTLCLNYTTRSVNDNVYACANGINDGDYSFDNLQQFDVTWYHRFSKTVHIATESWYMYQHRVPNLAGRVVNPISPELGTNGATCHVGVLRCTASEYAIVNYVEKEFSPKLFVSFRSEVVNDRRGQRTGYTTKYSENTLSLTKWIGSTIQIRPELRFEHAYDQPAYDGGRTHSQFTAASDLIFHF
jgi:Putative beta-barrel porin-2, OmpL-like. bbp2